MFSSSEFEVNDKLPGVISATDLCTNIRPVLLIIRNCNGMTETGKNIA